MSAQPIDFAAEGLLDGLDGAERADRLELLTQLAAQGVPLADLRQGTAEGTLLLFGADRAMVGSDRYTAREVAAMAELDIDTLANVRRAMGLPIPDPDEPVFTETEIEAAKMVNIVRAAGISDEETFELLRVLGRSMAQTAAALRMIPIRLAAEPGLSEAELSARFAGAVEKLYPLVDPLVSNILALHLRHAAESEVIGTLVRSDGTMPGARPVTVAFADLVGFTRLGEEVPAEELGRLAIRLEALAGEVANGPVRLVKTIGDAAMLASTEPEPLIDASLALLEAADAQDDDFPQLRAGAATGEALARGGDWFGRPVNRASRITALARPGSMLVESEIRDALGDAYQFSFAGERRLRGVRTPVALYRTRRAAA